MLPNRMGHLSTDSGSVQDQARAVRIAPTAIRSLRSGSGWRLLSSHTHAVNFIDALGKLVSFTQDPIRMGPFSIELEAIPDGLRCAPKNRVIHIEHGDSARIVIGPISIDLTAAARWNPRPDWSALQGRGWQPTCLPVILARLRRSAPGESLARVVPTLDGRGDNPTDASLQRMPQAAAAASALRLIGALAEGDLQGAATDASALAGTGLGLTPSGDDFLIGVMFGTWSTLPAVKARALSMLLARDSAARTNQVSRAWLSAAIDGQAIQAWHDLADAIASADTQMLDQACRNLLGLGHTSGADALAGFAAFHFARTLAGCQSRPISLCDSSLGPATRLH